MNITRETIKSTLRTIMAEETEYQTFFKKALEKAGKSIPSMSDEEKKEFFNKIDAAWNAKGEKNEALKGDQHKLDVDGDGDIEADDLADLRKGKKSKVKKDEPMKESVEQIEAELQDTVDKTIDRVANNVNNMREALKNVWLEASIPNLPEKG